MYKNRDGIRKDTVRSMLQQEESLVQKIRNRRLTCVKNGKRTITTKSVTLSYMEGKKQSGSTTKNIDDVYITEDVAEQDKSIRLQQAVELAKDRAAWSWAPEANVDWYGEILPSLPFSLPLPSLPLPSPSLPFLPLPSP